MSEYFIRSATGDIPVSLKSVEVKEIPETQSVDGYMLRFKVEVKSLKDLENFRDEVGRDLIISKDTITIYDDYIE